MELTVETIEATLSSFFRRCEAAKLVGGIPLYLVVDRRAVVPDGWALDQETLYYLPPNTSLDSSLQ